MTPDDLFEYFLSPEGMEQARRELCKTFPFFLHGTPLKNVPLIRDGGLRPTNPGSRPPNVVQRRITDGADQVLCLRPFRTQKILLGKNPPLIKFAISSEDLPTRIGLDWSYDGCWSLAPIIHESDTHKLPEVIFTEVAQRRGSIVSYDRIDSSVLRVCPQEAPDSHISSWPLLSQVLDEQIARFID